MEDSLKRSIARLCEEAYRVAHSVGYDLKGSIYPVDMTDRDTFFLLQLVCEAHAALRLACKLTKEAKNKPTEK